MSFELESILPHLAELRESAVLCSPSLDVASVESGARRHFKDVVALDEAATTLPELAPDACVVVRGVPSPPLAAALTSMLRRQSHSAARVVVIIAARVRGTDSLSDALVSCIALTYED